MSQGNVEIYRRYIEDVIAGEFDAEAAISKMAEHWDPEIELDASEAPALDLSGVMRGREAARAGWRGGAGKGAVGPEA